MATFDASNMSPYWRSTVTMALSYIISEIKRDVESRGLSATAKLLVFGYHVMIL